jgi:hypothetical protein
MQNQNKTTQQLNEFFFKKNSFYFSKATSPTPEPTQGRKGGGGYITLTSK